MFNADNGRTLGFFGHSEVKYTYFTSDEKGMTVMVRISGGAKHFLKPPFMIFKENSIYPIRGVPDDLPSFSNRTGLNYGLKIV